MYTPGKSLAPLPRIKTFENFFKLWFPPGTYVIDVNFMFRRNFKVFLLAELGFLGEVIRTRTTVPSLWGLLRMILATLYGFLNRFFFFIFFWVALLNIKSPKKQNLDILKKKIQINLRKSNTELHELKIPYF